MNWSKRDCISSPVFNTNSPLSDSSQYTCCGLSPAFSKCMTLKSLCLGWNFTSICSHLVFLPPSTECCARTIFCDSALIVSSKFNCILPHYLMDFFNFLNLLRILSSEDWSLSIIPESSQSLYIFKYFPFPILSSSSKIPDRHILDCSIPSSKFLTLFSYFPALCIFELYSNEYFQVHFLVHWHFFI